MKVSIRHTFLTLLAILGSFTILLQSVTAASPTPLSNTERQKLFMPSNFRVEIDGISIRGFKEITGIESEVEVIEFREGGINSGSHKRPGPARYGNLIFTREFVKDDALREWYKKVLSGTTERKSVSIIYLDRAGNEVMRYNLFEAWPMRWKAPELNSKGGTALESIEFVVEKVERI